MPSTRELRRRIRSVRNTAQITRAMQMVAAAKMRKAQQAALAGRPYAELMDEVLSEVSSSSGDVSHPLMEEREDGYRVLVLVSPDKGLCGALPTNLMREAARQDAEQTQFVTVGKKASQFIVRTRRPLLAEFDYQDAPVFSEARALSNYLQKLFLEDKKMRQIDLLYMKFVSTLEQRPETRPLLPAGHFVEHAVAQHGERKARRYPQGGVEFLFEPAPQSVLGSLLPHYLNFELYHVMLEAKASEHSARMVAMKNATDNANQLIKDLTLEFNKLRQSIITNELLDITTASMAV